MSECSKRSVRATRQSGAGDVEPALRGEGGELMLLNVQDVPLAMDVPDAGSPESFFLGFPWGHRLASADGVLNVLRECFAGRRVGFTGSRRKDDVRIRAHKGSLPARRCGVAG